MTAFYFSKGMKVYVRGENGVGYRVMKGSWWEKEKKRKEKEEQIIMKELKVEVNLIAERLRKEKVSK